MSIEFNRGLQVAIDIINKEADALADDFGTVDPDTGALAVWDLETYNDLRELADKMRHTELNSLTTKNHIHSHRLRHQTVFR